MKTFLVVWYQHIVSDENHLEKFTTKEEFIHDYVQVGYKENIRKWAKDANIGDTWLHPVNDTIFICLGEVE